MGNQYVFTRMRKIGKAGWENYVLKWEGGDANGNSIENLIDCLKTKKRVINSKEGDYIISGQTRMDGMVIKDGASDLDLERFCRIGEEEGVYFC